MITKEEILELNAFDLDYFKIKKPYTLQSIIEAMEEYATEKADEQSVAFYRWMDINAQYSGVNYKKEKIYSIDKSNNVYTLSELLQIFKNENK